MKPIKGTQNVKSLKNLCKEQCNLQHGRNKIIAVAKEYSRNQNLDNMENSSTTVSIEVITIDEDSTDSVSENFNGEAINGKEVEKEGNIEKISKNIVVSTNFEKAKEISEKKRVENSYNIPLIICSLYFCKLCHFYTSQENWKYHISEKLHKKKLANISPCHKISSNGVALKLYEGTSVSSRLRNIDDPAVGLEFVTEDESKIPAKFNCSLCRQSFCDYEIFHHVISAEHKSAYAEMDPDANKSTQENLANELYSPDSINEESDILYSKLGLENKEVEKIVNNSQQTKNHVDDGKNVEVITVVNDSSDDEFYGTTSKKRNLSKDTCDAHELSREREDKKSQTSTDMLSNFPLKQKHLTSNLLPSPQSPSLPLLPSLHSAVNYKPSSSSPGLMQLSSLNSVPPQFLSSSLSSVPEHSYYNYSNGLPSSNFNFALQSSNFNCSSMPSFSSGYPLSSSLIPKHSNSSFSHPQSVESYQLPCRYPMPQSSNSFYYPIRFPVVSIANPYYYSSMSGKTPLSPEGYSTVSPGEQCLTFYPLVSNPPPLPPMSYLSTIPPPPPLPFQPLCNELSLSNSTAISPQLRLNNEPLLSNSTTISPQLRLNNDPLLSNSTTISPQLRLNNEPLLSNFTTISPQLRLNNEPLLSNSSSATSPYQNLSGNGSLLSFPSPISSPLFTTKSVFSFAAPNQSSMAIHDFSSAVIPFTSSTTQNETSKNVLNLHKSKSPYSSLFSKAASIPFLEDNKESPGEKTSSSLDSLSEAISFSSTLTSQEIFGKINTLSSSDSFSLLNVMIKDFIPKDEEVTEMFSLFVTLCGKALQFEFRHILPNKHELMNLNFKYMPLLQNRGFKISSEEQAKAIFDFILSKLEVVDMEIIPSLFQRYYSESDELTLISSSNSHRKSKKRIRVHYDRKSKKAPKSPKWKLIEWQHFAVPRNNCDMDCNDIVEQKL